MPTSVRILPLLPTPTAPQVLHQEHRNLSCITLTKDNSVGSRYHFDLPFVEMSGMQGGVALVWSAVRRLPLADRSIDLIHTRMAVPMSLDSEVNEGMLYDWHRLLKPGGYVVITSDVSRYLTGNSEKFGGALGAADTSFAELLPAVVQRMGWEVMCAGAGKRKNKASSKSKGVMQNWVVGGGCQVDDRGKPASHIFRKPTATEDLPAIDAEG